MIWKPCINWMLASSAARSGAHCARGPNRVQSGLVVFSYIFLFPFLSSDKLWNCESFFQRRILAAQIFCFVKSFLLFFCLWDGMLVNHHGVAAPQAFMTPWWCVQAPFMFPTSWVMSVLSRVRETLKQTGVTRAISTNSNGNGILNIKFNKGCL